jgi:exopolysaccharide production protein ExoZ
MSKLVNIQILRAVAALSVVLYHVGVEKEHICEAAGRVCHSDLWFGLDGVKLFFMISGFIMVVTNWNNFAKHGATVDFMRRRIERIVPLYWLITTLAVVGVALVPSMLNVPVLDPLYIAASYLFYPMARVNGVVWPIANLGWTLELEMMFYLIFSIALLFNRKLGLWLSMAIIVLFTAARIAGLFGESIAMNFWGDPIILEFVMGMAAAILYKSGAELPRVGLWAMIAAFVAFTGFVLWQDAWIGTFAKENLFRSLVMALPALPLFMIGVLGPQIDAAKRLARIGLLFGDASYSLYLIHPFILRPFAKIWARLFDGILPLWVFECLAPIAPILAGLALFWFVEKPLSNYFAKRRVRTTAPSRILATSAVPRET